METGKDLCICCLIKMFKTSAERKFNNYVSVVVVIVGVDIDMGIDILKWPRLLHVAHLPRCTMFPNQITVVYPTYHKGGTKLRKRFANSMTITVVLPISFITGTSSR